MSLTHLSLFSGVGGLDIAAHWAGFETVAFCEWKDYQNEVLRKRFPNAAPFKDIHDLTKEAFYSATGLSTVTVISGGFPCQPFSVAGKRGGALDDRYLWPEMLRVVKELRPTWVLGENVAGLLSMVQPSKEIEMESREHSALGSENDRILEQARQRGTLCEIIESLEQAGYSVQTFAIPACAVKAPHERMRVFIVARTKNTIRKTVLP